MFVFVVVLVKNLSLLILMSLLTSVISQSCLNPISESAWTIYVADATPYLVKIKGDDSVSVNQGSSIIAAVVNCFKTCQLSPVSYGASGNLTEQFNQNFELNLLLSSLIDNSNGGRNSTLLIYQIGYISPEIEGRLLTNADMFKGYYYDNYEDILFTWGIHSRYLKPYYEGTATFSYLNSNTSAKFITYKDNNSTYNLQLIDSLPDDLWTTDQKFLFVINDSTSETVTSLNLTHRIIPKKNICPDIPELISNDIIYGLIPGCIGLLIIIVVFLVCYFKRRKRNDTFLQGHLNWITNNALTNYMHQRSSSNIEEERRQTSDDIYSEPAEFNHYNVPGSDHQIAYDLSGRRVSLHQGDPGYLQPVEFQYDYVYSGSRQKSKKLKQKKDEMTESEKYE